MRPCLIPEVQAFIDEGKLSEFDSDWIKNLPSDQQLNAALKCMKIETGFYPNRDMVKDPKQRSGGRGPFQGSPNGS